MCTAISFNGYFGRTLDYECGFGEEAVVIPRGFTFSFRHREDIVSKYAIAGMARMESAYPLFFDGMNEAGVGIAGLNFVGNAYFRKAKKGDVAAFELIPYILSQAGSVSEAKALLEGVEIADTPFSPALATAQLHWMIADKNESLTVEACRSGLHLYESSVGVLTNNPPFPYQLMNLNNYINLTSKPAENRFSTTLCLEKTSRGMGAIGLPGDWSSSSRFVRAAFVKENAANEKSVEHFFAIMSQVRVPKGCMILEDGEYEYTRYTSCMDFENGVYYYKGYNDLAPKSVGFNNA